MIIQGRAGRHINKSSLYVLFMGIFIGLATPPLNSRLNVFIMLSFCFVLKHVIIKLVGPM